MATPNPGAAANRWRMALVAATVTAVATVVAACSKQPAPAMFPEASSVLAASAQAMASVTTAHLSLTVAGSLDGDVQVQSAEGDVTRSGDADATVDVNELGVLFAEHVVVTGGIAYLRGPTGGYQSEPAASIYNVSQLLDPTQGVAGILGQATQGKILASQTVAGTPCYEVRAEVPTAILTGLTKLAAGQGTVKATLWIARQGDHLVQFKLPFLIPNAKQPTTLTAVLTRLNAPVNIQAPATS